MTIGTRTGKVSMFVNPAFTGLSHCCSVFFVFYFVHFSLTLPVDGELSIPMHFKNAVTNRGKYVHKHLKCKRLTQRLTNVKFAVLMFDGVITL